MVDPVDATTQRTLPHKSHEHQLPDFPLDENTQRTLLETEMRRENVQVMKKWIQLLETGSLPEPGRSEV